MPGEDLAHWYRELHELLNAVANARQAYGAARGAAPLSHLYARMSDKHGEDVLERIVRWVKAINATAERLAASDPALRGVVQPLLGVPGERPEVDLRPWWSRWLGRLSANVRRTEALERLETLRFEADAAMMRAVARLSRG